MRRAGKPFKRVVIWIIPGMLLLASAITLIAMPKVSKYTEVVAAKGNLATYYSFSGSVEAKNRQTVLADKAMQIKTVKVKVGTAVTADTVLITNTMGQEIKTSISGEVSNIYVDENAQVMPGTKLMDVVDYSDLQLVVQVDEYDLPAVSKNKAATVTIHAINKDVNAKITDVSKEGVYLNGVTNFTATLSLSAENDLRVGMSAEAKVLNQSAMKAVILPMSAIQFDELNNPYVFVKGTDEKPIKVGITVGINDGVKAQIKSGVKAGMTVLIPPAALSPVYGLGSGRQSQQGPNSTSQGSNNSQSSSGGGNAR